VSFGLGFVNQRVVLTEVRIGREVFTRWSWASAVRRVSKWILDKQIRATYHEVEVNVVNAQALQTAVDTLGDAVVPCVVELCGDPDL